MRSKSVFNPDEFMKQLADEATEQSHLRALSLGFNDAGDLKAWGEEMERERLVELAFKNGDSE